MADKTFVLLKPDAIKRGLMGEIINRFEKKGISIVKCRMLVADRKLAEEHYAEHAGKPFFNGIVDYLTSGPVLAMVLMFEGNDKLYAGVRLMIGSTDPQEALPGSIRGDFGTRRPYNVIHGSDSIESAQREIGLWFPDE
jgi:nucleoside-diphosphate kinase